MLNRKTLALATLLPILTGVLLVLNKHYLLRVPKIGFILHAIAGGLVPPYMDASIMDIDSEWLRPNDVVVSVPVKAGTTWTLYTVHMLRYKGNPPPFRDIYEEVAWAEFVFFPRQTVAERVKGIQSVSQRHSPEFNIIKTHVSPPKLRLRDDVKYIVVFRSVFDMVASARTFGNNHSPAFAKLWGGFPPSAGDPEPMSWEEYEKMMMVDGGGGKPLIGEFFFSAVLNWWPHRKRSNVLFVHYNDRIKDDKTQIRRMAEFLGISLTEGELERITRLVSFQELKKVESQMEGKHFLDGYKKRGLIPEEVSSILVTDREGAMLNKGPKRKGMAEIPETFRQRINAMMNQTLTPRIVEWVEHGGQLPIEDELKASSWP